MKETAMLTAITLNERAVLALDGAQARDFLQGLISADIERLQPDAAIYTTLLTPQGRVLFDFFLAQAGSRILIDCDRSRRDELAAKLTFYRLRADVSIKAVDDLAVSVLFGPGTLDVLGCADRPGAAVAQKGGVLYVDPRRAELGARAILPVDHFGALLSALDVHHGEIADYQRHRLALGVPDGARDIAIGKDYLLECGLDALNAVDFDKGCYIGQELTARTHFRGTVRRHLVPVKIDGPAPPFGTPVLLGATQAGEMRSSADGRGLAMLKARHLETARTENQVFTAGEAHLKPLIDAAPGSGS